MNEQKHSPLPWRIDEYQIISSDGESVGDFGTGLPADLENARFQVRAVNAHPALVEACESAQKFLIRVPHCVQSDNLSREITAALALAKGEK